MKKIILTTISITIAIIFTICIVSMAAYGVGETKKMGVYVKIQHELGISLYCHLKKGSVKVKKGQYVEKGDTLIHIISKEVIAEYEAQKSLENAATLQSEKIDSGSRKELVSISKELWDGTKADLNLAKTTYERITALYEDSIVSLQRRDEAEAIYKSALAAERAAYYQYKLAMDGAQEQDKESAKSMAKAAQSNTEVVNALLNDSKLTSPISGQVATIALNKGELSSIGTSLITIVDIENPYLVLNVREDLLINFKMDSDILCRIPALDLKDIPFTINYISPLGSFATWKATKDTGGYDLRTFEIQAVPKYEINDLRPGMSVLITIDK